MFLSPLRSFIIPIPLPQYKFVVDGEWKYAPDQAAMYDEGGNVNNVLEVQQCLDLTCRFPQSQSTRTGCIVLMMSLLGPRKHQAHW